MKENISIRKNIYSSNKFREVVDTNFSELSNTQNQFDDRKSRIYGPSLYIALILIIIFINSAGNQYTAGFLKFAR